MESDEFCFLLMGTVSVKVVIDQSWLIEEKKKIMENYGKDTRCLQRSVEKTGEASWWEQTETWHTEL